MPFFLRLSFFYIYCLDTSENFKIQNILNIVEDPQKKAEYFIEQIKKIASSTNTWGLGFFIALLFTFLSSIRPGLELLTQIKTNEEQSKYFTQISKKLAKATDSIQKKYNTNLDTFINKNRYQLSKESVTRLSGLKLTSLEKTAVASNKDAFDSINKLQEFKNYHPVKIANDIKKIIALKKLDSLISKINSRKALQQDSLAKKLNINFDVPTLKAFPLSYRNGLVFWMVLLNFFLIYFLAARKKILSYFNKIYVLCETWQVLVNEYHIQDINLPFWAAPIFFRNKNTENKINAFIGKWQWITQTLILLICLLFTIFLQAYIAWIGISTNTEPYFSDDNFVYTFITTTLLAITVFVVLHWLMSSHYSFDQLEPHKFSGTKREFIKVAVASVIFLILLPKSSKYFPKIKGNFTRPFRRKKQKSPIDLKEGFYIHYKGKDTPVVHFVFGNQTSFAGKVLSKDKLHGLKSKLTPITFADLTKKEKFRLQHSQYVFEHIALGHAVKGELQAAMDVLFFSQKYFYKNCNLVNIEHNNRICFLLAGLIIKYNPQFNQAKKEEVKKKIDDILLMEKANNMVRPQKSIKLIFDNINNPHTKFHSKWSKKEATIPWKLPPLVF